MPSRTCGTMTISLPTAMLAKIEHARQVEDRTRSEFVRQAIRVYLARSEAESRFRDAAGAPADGGEVREEGTPDQTDGRARDAAAGRIMDRVRDAVRDGKDRI